MDNSIFPLNLSSFRGKTTLFPDILRKIPNHSHDTDKKPIKCLLKNPCKGCQGKSGIISPVDKSTGSPHSYRLICADCGRFQRWVSSRELGKQGGRDND